MFIYELVAAERLPSGRFRVSFTYAAMIGNPATGEVWTVDVPPHVLLNFAKFRRAVLAQVGIAFALFPDQRFHRGSGTAPLRLPIVRADWDFRIQRALIAGSKETSNSSAA